MSRVMWGISLLCWMASAADAEESVLAGVRSSSHCPCAACAGKTCAGRAEENWLDTIEPPENCSCGSGAKRFQRMRQRPYVEGLDQCFNCNCRGSYKHPVPPQSTYHWPGMYGAPMMTASLSPWQGEGLRRFREVNTVVAPGQPLPAPAEASMSRAMQGLYR